MKTYSIALYALMFTSLLSAQEIQKLENDLDSLKRIKIVYQNKIDEIQSEYQRIEAEINRIKFEPNIGDIYYAVLGTNIIRTPEKYEIITYLPRNSKVKMIEQTITHYKIDFNNSIGWVDKSAIIPEAIYLEKKGAKKAIAVADSIKKAQSLIQQETQRKEYKANLIRKYGVEITNKILSGKIWIGMTDEMAIESLGRPQENNRTIGSWGVHEQWVYRNGDLFVYFENGILTSWQD